MNEQKGSCLNVSSRSLSFGGSNRNEKGKEKNNEGTTCFEKSDVLNTQCNDFASVDLSHIPQTNDPISKLFGENVNPIGAKFCTAWSQSCITMKSLGRKLACGDASNFGTADAKGKPFLGAAKTESDPQSKTKHESLHH